MRGSDKVRIVSAVKSPGSVCVSTCTLQHNIPTFVKSMRRSDKVRIVSAVKLPGSACQYMYITVQHSYLCQVNEEVRLGECHCSEVTRDCLCRNAYHSTTFLPLSSPWGSQTRWVWLKEVTRLSLIACQYNYVCSCTTLLPLTSPWGVQTRCGLSL